MGGGGGGGGVAASFQSPDRISLPPLVDFGVNPDASFRHFLINKVKKNGIFLKPYIEQTGTKPNVVAKILATKFGSFL